MTPRVGGDFRIVATPTLGLRSGETVSVHVLKRLGGNKWAVGIKGRVVPAYSRLDLSPGLEMRARVTFQGGRLVLTREDTTGDAGETLTREGLTGRLSELAVSALIRSGHGATAENLRKVRGFFSRTGSADSRKARYVAALLDKGIEVDSSGAERLVGLLSLGERGGSGRQSSKRRDLPRNPAAVRTALESIVEKAGKPGAISVFNHLRGENQSWIVLPFLFKGDGRDYPGTMKFLFDPFLRKTRRFALSVAPDGGETLSFYLPLEGKKILRVFAEDKKMKLMLKRSLGKLTPKFNNMGIEVDDTIHSGGKFDGFSPMWEGAVARGIDTTG
jgi:hypothetical protein